ncbi:hypothetical protein glysoja_046676 [Glycine soja]|uniref:Transmembrane protein 147 n=1 Tax=Glycine soja TaxID=3848 RepID=A0A0B2RII5_GLYSO|nr:hypothetical protein glysoja_046676 [Glycine soja]
MTVFHFFNCAILTFGPHAVFYFATPLFRRMIALIRIRRMLD